MGLLQGTTIWTTNAPSGLTQSIPAALNKVQYTVDQTSAPPRGILSVTGILTDAEKATTKAISTDPDWSAAVDRVGKQADNFFNNVLFGIFPPATQAAAKAVLLAGDIPPPPPPASPSDPAPVDNNTAGPKRFYFIQGFMPFLRNILSARLIINTVSGPANIPTTDLTTLLISTIIQVGTPPQTALTSLSSIQNAPASSATSWSGYLIVPTTDQYIVGVKGGFTTQPPPLMVNSQPVPFTQQQTDPNDVWFTNPQYLTAGLLYSFVVTGQSLSNLQWKSTRSPLSDIPSSALLPDYASGPTFEVFKRLYKASLVINGFNLSVAEITYFFNNASDFGSIDFNAVSLVAWERLADYSTFRGSMPAMPKTPLDLFAWAKGNPDPSGLVSMINSVTNWTADDITKLITPPHLNLQTPASYVNEQQLILLQKAVTVKTKIAIDVDLLFTWADPLSFLWKKARLIAESIRNQVRSRYDVDTWEQVSQPLFSTLRGNQRDALIAFLLVQQPLKEWGLSMQTVYLNSFSSMFKWELVYKRPGSSKPYQRCKYTLKDVS